MTRLIIPLLLLLTLSPALADDDTMNTEIDYLLESVASSDCTFIRNGDEHQAADARDHLQMKRRRGKRYFDTTEEFIERLASKSSWSGKVYRIRCGSEEVDAADWFNARLAEQRTQPGS